jgi:hypothetical protein
MRITEDTPTRLDLRDRSWWISTLCFAAAAILLTGFLVARDQLGFLGLTGLFLVFELGSLHATDVSFDKVGRNCDIRRFDVMRLTRTRLTFADILDVKVEIGPLQADPGDISCRLSLVTASAVLPLSATYQPGLERYNDMRDRILDVLFAGASRPPGPDLVEALAREGRVIDAVAALRNRERLTLTAARARVVELLKENGS